MRKGMGLILTLSILGALSPVFADMDQTSLTLSDAQEQALQQSPDYQKAHALESEMSWHQVQSLAEGFLPQLSISGQHFFAENYSYLNVEFGSPTPIQFPEIYPQTNLNFDAKMDIFDGFKNLHEMDAADRSHQAAKILLDMAEENVKTLEDHLRIVQDRLQNGEATKYDLLRVDVQLSTAKSNLIEVSDDVVLTRESLARTMGLKQDGRPLAGDLPVINADKIVGQLTDVNFDERPDVKAKIMQAKSAEDQSAAEGSFWVPKISLIGEYQFYNTPDYLTTGLSNNNDFRTDYFL